MFAIILNNQKVGQFDEQPLPFAVLQKKNTKANDKGKYGGQCQICTGRLNTQTDKTGAQLCMA